MRRVLLVDDDADLCAMLTRYLSKEGFTVDAVYRGDLGFERAKGAQYDLVLLDVMLPGMDGFDVLRRLREQSHVPVIMLTARAEDVDRIVGLEVGADDYVPKPFNSRELLARMRAILRRVESRSASSSDTSPTRVIRVDDLELDHGARTVSKAGTVIELTTGEFDVLSLLLSSAGRIVSRDQIAKGVLGRTLTPFERSIDMHVSKLRRKLGSLADGRARIRTVRNAGYLYVSTRVQPLSRG